MARVEMDRRNFLKTAAAAAAGFLASAVTAKAESNIFLPLVFCKEHSLPLEYPPDLTEDVVASERLPDWFRERMARPERVGELERRDYAVTTTLVEVKNDSWLHKEEKDQETIDYLEGGLNQWYSVNLNQGQLRFEGTTQRIEIDEDELRSGMSPLPIDDLVSVILNRTEEVESIGHCQRLNVVFIKGIKGVTRVAGNTVIMSLPEDQSDCKNERQKGILAHLLGHALGLSHPREDIDAVDTELEVRNSQMHPSILDRGLKDSIILDSQLNPHKARQIATGCFPYRGIIYTGEDGAMPLTADLETAAEREIKIAHGLYIFPCDGKETAVRILNPGIIDFGSAVIRQEVNYQFTETGEHVTRGIGLGIEGEPTQRLEGVSIKGGTFIGFWKAIEAKYTQGLKIERTAVVDGRRINYDATRPGGDEKRGKWLYVWNPPKEDNAAPPESYFSYGAGICLQNCNRSSIKNTTVGHTTLAVADYDGLSNCFEENDLSECAWGIRFWHSKGTEEQPIVVKKNLFDYNVQPDPWWWMMGDGAAVVGTGVEEISVEENRFRFGGDGILFCGFPYPPGRVENVYVHRNEITHCYAHGLELDFCQDCQVEGNKISDNWLSGIWNGHSSGVLIHRNIFERNNVGRLFNGWADSQGAISCPEGGRVTIVGNRFNDNWVAVNLLKDFQMFWWPFSGDSREYRVTGNTFSNNWQAIKLKSIKDSQFLTNLLAGNQYDITEEDDCQGNTFIDNGPSVNPEDFPEAVCFSHNRITLTNLDGKAKVPVYRVDRSGVSPVVPDYRLVFDSPTDQWAEARVEGGKINIYPRTAEDFAGLKAAVLELYLDGRTTRIPLKMMAGSTSVSVSTFPFQEERATELGQVAMPVARFGSNLSISSLLETKQLTEIKGSDPFSLRFSNPGFSVPAGRRRVLMILDSTDQLRLWLSPELSDPPVFATDEPLENESWRNAIFPVTPGQNNFIFQFDRVVFDSEDPEYFPLTNLFLVPLGENEAVSISAQQAVNKKIGLSGWLLGRRKTTAF